MKILRFMLISAAALGGCSPYEHGHYAEDVSYGNAAGDPPGTPILFSRGSGGSAIQEASYTDHAFDTHNVDYGPHYAEPAHAITSHAAPSIIEQPHYSTASYEPVGTLSGHSTLSAPLISAAAPVLSHGYAPTPLPRPAHARHSIDVTPGFSPSHVHDAPTVSVDHLYQPSVSVDHQYAPTVSVDHQYAPTVSVDHHYQPTVSVDHQYNAPIYTPSPVKKRRHHRDHGHHGDVFATVASPNYESVGPIGSSLVSQPLHGNYVDVAATSVSAPLHIEAGHHIPAPHHAPAPHHVPAPIAQPAPERITAPAQYVNAPDIRMQAAPVYAPGFGAGYGQGYGAPQGYGGPVPATHATPYGQPALPPVPFGYGHQAGGYGPQPGYGAPQGFPQMPGYGPAQGGCVTTCGGTQVF